MFCVFCFPTLNLFICAVSTVLVAKLANSERRTSHCGGASLLALSLCVKCHTAQAERLLWSARSELPPPAPSRLGQGRPHQVASSAVRAIRLERANGPCPRSGPLAGPLRVWRTELGLLVLRATCERGPKSHTSRVISQPKEAHPISGRLVELQPPPSPPPLPTTTGTTTTTAAGPARATVVRFVSVR